MINLIGSKIIQSRPRLTTPVGIARPAHFQRDDNRRIQARLKGYKRHGPTPRAEFNIFVL